MSNKQTHIIALLLFFSGFCALLYQLVWLRELRLIFGSSTLATASVLAVFMGGLGLGSARLGKVADRVARPLLFYGKLELGIALWAAMTPLLAVLFRSAYISFGGIASLGETVALGVRFLAALLLMGPPTFLMGGTLPAAVRAVETAKDHNRRHLGYIYGSNTLGGVLGVLLATFFLFEHYGIRQALWFACLLNLVVAVGAILLGRSKLFSEKKVFSTIEIEENAAPAATSSVEAKTEVPVGMPGWAVYLAAAVLGFAFFSMEIVWYRMMAPVLGGTTYTFGMILAVALLGIVTGSWVYAGFKNKLQPSPALLSMLCGLEACFLAIPFWFGDRLALFTHALKSLDIFGFAGIVGGWLFILLLVVFPPAVAAGYSFPLLVSMRGQGDVKVGAHTGMVYAWNTVGSIAGALLTAIILLPFLTAPVCWQVMVAMLAILSVIVLLPKINCQPVGAVRAVGLFCLPLLSLVLLQAEGPTPFWRHSGIGSGTLELDTSNKNSIQKKIHYLHNGVSWEREGRESSIALLRHHGLSFILNGKSDGNSWGDAPTQVMAPMVAAILHPQPERAMVIGLGTGSSSGWLGSIPSMRQVDVVELEPAIIEVARQCAPVNNRMLENPKVNLIIGDGREALLTGREQYDLIFSEPSNPYRVGISSLYTREFYQAVVKRLAPGGYFSQWVQGYHMDAQTIRTIIATLGETFPYVEIWQSHPDDLLFVCSMEPRSYSVDQLRHRIREQPFQSALLATWQTIDLEGFLARFVASDTLVRKILSIEQAKDAINTDDRMLIEYGFGRSLGKKDLFSIADIRLLAQELQQDRPQLSGSSSVDWQRVRRNYLMLHWYHFTKVSLLPDFTRQEIPLVMHFNAYLDKNYAAILNAWQNSLWQDYYPLEIAILADSLAEMNDAQALTMAERLEVFWPGAANAVRTRYFWRAGNRDDALQALENAVNNMRIYPWNPAYVMSRLLDLCSEIVNSDPEKYGPVISSLLAEPFAAAYLYEHREVVLLDIAAHKSPEKLRPILEKYEPYVPWGESFLRLRLECYQETGSPFAARAAADLEQFKQQKEMFFQEGLVGPDNGVSASDS